MRNIRYLTLVAALLTGGRDRCFAATTPFWRNATYDF